MLASFMLLGMGMDFAYGFDGQLGLYEVRVGEVVTVLDAEDWARFVAEVDRLVACWSEPTAAQLRRALVVAMKRDPGI